MKYALFGAICTQLWAHTLVGAWPVNVATLGLIHCITLALLGTVVATGAGTLDEDGGTIVPVFIVEFVLISLYHQYNYI